MKNTNVSHHFLIANPWTSDPVFDKTVIYICEYNQAGSVGLIINRPLQLSLHSMFEKMQIEVKAPIKIEVPLLFGGPLKPEQGSVIHRKGKWRTSVCLASGEVTVTTSNDIIYDMAQNKGPKSALIALGYAAWAENQLLQELIDNVWLVCPYRSEILYEVPFLKRWDYALATLGIQAGQLTASDGHA